MSYKIRKIDMEGHLTSLEGSLTPLLFHKRILGDGCILAFYSENPAGCCTDGDKGWMVVNPDKQRIEETYETMSMHISTGGGFNYWLKEVLEKHGKGKIIKDEFGKHEHTMPD